MKTLQVLLGDDARAVVDEQIQALSALPEDVAKGVFDKVIRLLQSSTLHIAVLPSRTTTSTGDDRVGLGVFGIRELFAAARAGE